MPLDLDFNELSKKLKVNTKSIIKAWKLGKSDFEISNSLGIEQWKLTSLRQELQLARWKQTLQRRNLFSHNKADS